MNDPTVSGRSPVSARFRGSIDGIDMVQQRCAHRRQDACPRPVTAKLSAKDKTLYWEALLARPPGAPLVAILWRYDAFLDHPPFVATWPRSLDLRQRTWAAWRNGP